MKVLETRIVGERHTCSMVELENGRKHFLAHNGKRYVTRNYVLPEKFVYHDSFEDAVNYLNRF